MILRASLLVLAAAGLFAQHPGLSFNARVDSQRAIERARYQFVINNDKPFDEVYERKVFEQRVRKEMDEERILEKQFGVVITPDMLADEYQRIEVTTKAPEQWEVIKSVLGNKPNLVAEVFCRPLIVQRLLRSRFDYDRSIHAEPHQKARDARTRFQAGKKVTGARSLKLRKTAAGLDTQEMLRQAQSAAPPTSPGEPLDPSKKNQVVTVEPELAKVLQKELKKPGDVTTVLEHADRFDVYRLTSITDEHWKVQAVSFPKVGYDTWFESARAQLTPF